MADDELTKKIEQGVNEKLEKGGMLPEGHRIVMKQEEIDWDKWHPFETHEPSCGNCHYFGESGYCNLKNRVVMPSGLCPEHRHRRR